MELKINGMQVEVINISYNLKPAREMWSSIIGLVKSGTLSLKDFLQSCAVLALLQGDEPKANRCSPRRNNLIFVPIFITVD